MKSKISIREVAEKAGVSTATVSRVLNKSLYVSPELEEKVNRASQELGYVPNRLARSLRIGSSGMIGFLIPDIVNPFFSQIVKGAEDYLRVKGYFIFLVSSSGDPLKEEELLKALYSRNIEGIGAILLGELPESIKAISSHLPIVIIDNYQDWEGVSYVFSDNYDGMRKMMDYLIGAGNKSFAFLSGPVNTFSSRERLRAFEDAISEENSDCEIHFGDYTFESGREMLRRLKRIPNAIVCGNDMIAFGAMMELAEMKYDVPKTVSVTGFDDILFSRMTNPRLTTVRQDGYAMGKAAGEMLLRKISGQKTSSKVLLKTSLQIRESSNG
jgi:LacI family transcriptional regulator